MVTQIAIQRTCIVAIKASKVLYREAFLRQRFRDGKQFSIKCVANKDIRHSHVVLYGFSLAESRVSFLSKPYRPEYHLCHNMDCKFY